MNVEQIKKVENRILELKSQSLSLSDRQIKFEKILDKKNPKSIYNKREEYDNYESWEKDIEWYDSELENSIPIELRKINQWTVWLIELLEQNEIVTQKIENLTNQLLNYKCFGYWVFSYCKISRI